MNTAIEQIFDAARRLAPAERSAYLDDVCGSDAALRADVEALLQADAEAGDFLAEPGGQQTRAGTGQGDAIHRAAEQTSAALGGVMADLIPGYRIARFVASGGMGSVYEAEQEYPKRRVALKVIRPDRVTDEAQKRFEFETQVLATLQHPVVAQVFDAGFVGGDDDRRPYFAMEFVDGQTLTAYCAERKLGIRERLELVAAICDGVEHAHQKGVIHRDLKPDNILVNADGRPKILDFGVGRAVESDVQVTTLETDIGKIIGTLPYMSPEQAAGDSQRLDTRTDVYSIGVMAYELLTGHRPYELNGLSLPQVLRTIQEVEPPRLSSNNRALRGDLETIVSYALSKEPEDRYGSAAALAEDIRRYLRREPISKQPLTAWYQFAKFAARNKPLVAGVVSTFVVLLAGLTTSLLLLGRAQEAERQQGLAASAAQRRAAELEIMTGFQSTMLSGVKAKQMGQQLFANLADRFQEVKRQGVEVDVSIAEFEEALRSINATDAATQLIEAQWLTPAAQAVERLYADQPRVQAALQQTLAVVYRELGRLEEAEPLQTAALATRQRVLGDRAAETLLSLNEAGLLAAAQGKLATADALYQEALAGLREQQGDEHEDTLTVLNNLAAVRYRLGDHEEGERMQWAVLEGRRKTLGKRHPATLVAMNNVGYLLEQRGDFDEADLHYTEALTIRREVLGDEHPQTLISINNLGSLREEQGRLNEAEELYREALEIRTRVLGARHPDTLGSINNMGLVLKNQGRLTEALPYYESALEARTRLLGSAHPDTLTTKSNLGLLLHDLSLLDEAEPLLREALEGRTRVLGPGHRDSATALSNLAGLLDDQGRFDDAEVLYREAVQSWLEIDTDHPEMQTVRSNLASLLVNQQRLEEAEPILREVLDWRLERYGKRHPDTLSSINNLAGLYLKQGNYDKAEPLGRQVLAERRRALRPTHPDVLLALHNLGTVLFHLHKLDEAEQVWTEALEGRRIELGDDHIDTLNALACMGNLYLERDDLDEAEGYLRAALEGKRRTLFADHPQTLMSLNEMAGLLRRKGDLAGAEAYFREAVAGSRRARGDTHPDTLTFLNNLAFALREQGRLDEAEDCFREAYEGFRVRAGERHPNTLIALVNLGQSLETRGELDAAEANYREAVDGLRSTFGDKHPNTLITLGSLGWVLVSQKNLDQAEPILQEVLAGARHVYGEDHPSTCLALNSLGRLRREQGRWAEAEDYHRMALAGRRKAFGEEHSATMISIYQIGWVMLEAGRPREALDWLSRSELVAREVWAAQPGYLGCYLAKVGRARRDLGEFGTAEATLLEAYNLLQQDSAAQSDWIRDALEALLGLYEAWGEAEPDAGHVAEMERYRALLEQHAP